MPEPQRIVIIGKPGSGKSTFALRFAKQLQLPLLHLDKIFFVENWESRNYSDFLDEQQLWVERDNWIIDGNSIQSLWMRHSRATMVIYFNYPNWLCFLRIFKRFFSHDPAIDDMPAGCRKNVSWKLLTYLWGYEKRINPVLEWLRQIHPEIPFYEIRSDDELRAFEKKILTTRTS